MVFHDLNWEGVFKALEEFLGRQAEFIIEGTVGCSLIVSKEASMNKGVLEEIRLFNRAKRMLRPWKKVPAEEALAEEMLRRVNGLRAKYQRPGDEK